MSQASLLPSQLAMVDKLLLERIRLLYIATLQLLKRW